MKTQKSRHLTRGSVACYTEGMQIHVSALILYMVIPGVSLGFMLYRTKADRAGEELEETVFTGVSFCSLKRTKQSKKGNKKVLDKCRICKYLYIYQDKRTEGADHMDQEIQDILSAYAVYFTVRVKPYHNITWYDITDEDGTPKVFYAEEDATRAALVGNMGNTYDIHKHERIGGVWVN